LSAWTEAIMAAHLPEIYGNNITLLPRFMLHGGS
jgi:hypothetical protein